MTAFVHELPHSPRQQQIIDWVRAYIRKYGYGPTVREIAAGIDVASTSTVHRHLQTLAAQGRMTYEPARPRTIRPVGIDEGSS